MLKHALMAAAVFSAAACGRDAVTENEPKPGEIVEESAEDVGDASSRAREEISAAADEAVDATGDFIENELSQANARGFTARNVIGESVRGADGTAIAVIGDLLFSRDGVLRAVVLKDGSFLGLGGKPATIGADRFAFSLDAAGEVAVTAELTNGELKQLTASLAYQPTQTMTDEPGNLISMNELTGRAVVNANGDKIAEIFDIILTEPGRFETVILSTGGIGVLGDRLIALDIADVTIDPDSGVVAAASAPNFDGVQTFEY